ncbi:hypothetical protein HaLaN_21692, partial [Haematococcus lacustris]
MLPRDMPRNVYACFKLATLGLVMAMISMAPVGAAALNATATAIHCFTGTAEFVASVVDRYSAASSQTAAQFEQFLRDSTNSLLSECADGAEPLRPLRFLAQAGLVTVMTRLTQLFTAVRKVPVVVTGAAYAQLSFYVTQAMETSGNGSASNSSAMYDALHLTSNILGDLGSAGALADLQPFISSDPQQVVAWSDLPPYDNSIGSMYEDKATWCWKAKSNMLAHTCITVLFQPGTVAKYL